MSTAHIDLGKKGEQLVAHYLKKDGFEILAMNYTRRCGEIDIIARKNEVLAFVEVKVRSYAYFNISEVIVPAKQNKIIRTALSYIAEQRFEDMVYRFDVALLEQKNHDFEVTYMPNAFTQQSSW